MPAAGVYFVKSWSRASCAAALTAVGVGKSGSPAPKSITSMPDRRRRSTVVVTFMVGDSAIRLVRSASFIRNILAARFQSSDFRFPIDLRLNDVKPAILESWNQSEI